MAPLLSLLAFAAFALFATTAASPHIARHGLDHRRTHVAPRVHLENPPVRRRSLNRRCAPSNSTTSPVPSPTSLIPAPSSYPPTNSSMPSYTPLPSTTSSAPETTAAAPTSPSSPATTSSPPATTSSPPAMSSPATTSSPPATSTPPATTSTPPPAQTSTSSSNSGEPSYLTSVNSGQGTWFNDGLGACGFTSTNSQNIVAVSHDIFDNFPEYDGVNPNSNPVCGKSITIYYQGQSVQVTVVDRCVGCQELDLDMAPGPFGVLAALDVGRIDITWKFT